MYLYYEYNYRKTALCIKQKIEKKYTKMLSVRINTHYLQRQSINCGIFSFTCFCLKNVFNVHYIPLKK